MTLKELFRRWSAVEDAMAAVGLQELSSAETEDERRFLHAAIEAAMFLLEDRRSRLVEWAAELLVEQYLGGGEDAEA